MSLNDPLRPTATSATSGSSRPPRTMRPSPFMGLLRLVGVAALSVLCLPIIGGIYIAAAIFYLRKPEVSPALPNPADWVVVLFAGISLQLAAIAPLYGFVTPTIYKDATDEYGPMFTYPLIAIFFTVIAHRFRAAIPRHRRLGLERRPDVQRRLTEYKDAVLIRTYLAFPAALAFSIVQSLILRAIPQGEGDVGNWPGGDTGTGSTYDPVFWLTSFIYWVAIFTAANTMAWHGLLLALQQRRMLRMFTLSRAETGELREATRPESVVRWCGVWQGLISEVQHGPAGRSVTATTGEFTVVEAFIAGFFLAVRVIYINRTEAIQEFMYGAGFVVVQSCALFAALAMLTVLLQRDIEAQHVRIATLQHDVQTDIDNAAAREDWAPEERDLLQCKVRVLQSLDRLLQTADPRPRFLGMSLDSLRSTAVNVGLLMVNLFFFQIFLWYCYLGNPAT